MKANRLLILITLLAVKVACAQTVMPGRYISGKENSRTNDLRLYRDSSFIYSDWSSGSCWTSFTSEGKWQVNKDTLYLDELFESHKLVERRKYIIRSNIIYYADTTERNRRANWGPLIREEIVKQEIKKKLPYRRPEKGISDVYSNYRKSVVVDSIRYYRYHLYHGSPCQMYRDILLSQAAELRWSESYGGCVLQVYNLFKNCMPSFGKEKFSYIHIREYPLSILPDSGIVKNLKRPGDWFHIRLIKQTRNLIQLASYVGPLNYVVDPYSLFDLYCVGQKL